MKSDIIRYIFTACLSALLCMAGMLTTACSDDDGPVNTTTGTMSLDIDVDDSLLYPDGSPVNGLKALRPDTKDVIVKMWAAFGDYSHVWESFQDFPQAERYIAGGYRIGAAYGTFSSEGVECPFYSGSLSFDITAGQHTDVSLTLRLESCVSTVSFSREFTDYFKDVEAYLHADGGSYIECLPDDDRLIYTLPGETVLSLNLTLPDGRSTGFEASPATSTKSGCLYEYHIDLDDTDGVPVVVCKSHGGVHRVALTDAFLAAVPPAVEIRGWNTAETLFLPEGDMPNEKVEAVISSSRSLARIMLSTNSPSLNEQGFPSQVDLLHLSNDEAAIISQFGLSWQEREGNVSLDFTNLLGNLTYLTQYKAVSAFGLCAVDIDGRVASPVELRVETTAVDVIVSAVPTVVVGDTEACVTLESQAVDFAKHVGVELRLSDGSWAQTEIIDVVGNGDGSHSVRFVIPDGNSPIECRIVYCDEARESFTLRRVMPEFSLTIDPFATFAFVKIDAATLELVAMITERLQLFVDGKRGSVLRRRVDDGVIVLSGLAGNSSYKLTSTMIDSPAPDDYTPAQSFVTESIRQLPNAEFEERRGGPSYADMPSGGRFSQTEVAIFNWQNKRTFSMEEPKGWATVNAKTFSRGAANHNTWYMQPSAYMISDDVHSGNFAVCLRSVGFDLDGEEIADYTQTGEPYLKYSPVVPHIANRAAGKMFLGSYSFVPRTLEERYNDIVDWESRPISLNGYYKYSPSDSDPSDSGLALMEVYGEVDGRQQVIASGEINLPVANSYTAFTVQLEYKYFGVKATGLKLMFASSFRIGTIAEETAAVPLTHYAPEAEAVGSTLWLDHVNLSY